MKQEHSSTQIAGAEVASYYAFQNSSNAVFHGACSSPSPLPREEFGNAILRNLNKEILLKIAPSIKHICVEKNQVIYECGDDAQFLYFPETAVFSEFQILEDGKTAEVALIGREGMLGTASVLNSKRVVNWSQALIAGTAFKLDIDNFRECFHHCSETQNTIFDYLNSYITQISQRTVCNNHHSLVERLCNWILMIQDRCRQETLSLTQEKIASSLGTQRPSVTTTTQYLRELGTIKYSRGSVHILNRQKLASLGCDCCRQPVAAF